MINCFQNDAVNGNEFKRQPRDPAHGSMLGLIPCSPLPPIDSPVTAVNAAVISI